MIEWHIETRRISTLTPYHKNPRKLTQKQSEDIQKSIEKFGLTDKPLVQPDGTIIGGHQRIKVLKKMGYKEIPCLIPERPLDDKEIEEAVIRHNKNTGEWDWDILANQWELPDLINWGFDEKDLLDIVETIDDGDDEEGEILEPAKDEDAITQLGDLYELNEHRVVCGDSTLPEYVEKCLNGTEPILMVTDPPYGVEYDPSWRDPTKIGTDGIRSSVKSKGKVQNDDKVNWSLAWYLFPGSVAYIWCASWFLPEVAKSLDDCDYERKSLIIWVKQNFTLSRGDYHWQHEPCWYAVKKGHKHNWQGARDQATTWQIASMSAFGRSNQEDTKTNHGTQKPIECMARPIRNNTAKGEGVYDPFCGSGTSLIAAEQLGRIAYCIELSPAYCDIIVERWKKYMIKNKREYTIKRNGELVL